MRTALATGMDFIVGGFLWVNKKTTGVGMGMGKL